jgi:hypothetical protein
MTGHYPPVRAQPDGWRRSSQHLEHKEAGSTLAALVHGMPLTAKPGRVLAL